jgi:hypothetical protein
MQPEADGGANTLDNATVLCFDCHADAGHYNPRHPRGTKFSREELRAAKEEWFRTVKEGALTSPDADDVLHCRYLICRNLDVVTEILGGNFEQIPVTKPLLVDTDSGAFLGSIARELQAAPHVGRFYGGSFANREEYMRAHPDAIPADRASGKFSFYEHLRVPTQNELLTKWAIGRPLIRRLIESGAQPNDFAIIGSFFQECGTQDHYQEDLILRPLWGVFMAATNIGDSPETLQKIVAARTADENFRAFQPLDGPLADIDLPAAPIEPGATVIIPLGAALGPLSKVEEQAWSRVDSDVTRRGPVQLVQHSGTQQIRSHALVGPFLWPKGIYVASSGEKVHQEVHELDLSNVYVIDRYWEIGCCPHLFLVHDDSRLIYGGPLLASGRSQSTVSTFTVPTDVTTVVIAELEDEVTRLDALWLDGELLVAPRTLNRGRVFRIAVSAGMVVRLMGSYEPSREWSAVSNDAHRRAMLVDEFIQAHRPVLHPSR